MGFLTGAKHSLPGSFSAKKIGSKHQSSQICMRALEFYISNIVESKFVNDVLIRQRLGVRILTEKSRFLTHFVDFHEESERTGARRVVIRNHRVRISMPTFHLLQDPLCIHVTGGGVQRVWWQFWIFQNLENPQSRANFEGFGASREPLELPSRAACWCGGLGSLNGAKHSLPGSFSANN